MIIDREMVIIIDIVNNRRKNLEFGRKLEKIFKWNGQIWREGVRVESCKVGLG